MQLVQGVGDGLAILLDVAAETHVEAGAACHGGYGLRLTQESYRVGLYNPNAQTVVGTFAWRATDKPTTNRVWIWDFAVGAARPGFVYNPATDKIEAEIDGAAFIAAGPTVTLNTWYVIDYRLTCTGASWTLDWSIDGSPQTQVVAAMGAGATVTRLGPVCSPVAALDPHGATWNYDDIAASLTSADYPIGGLQVLGMTADQAAAAEHQGINTAQWWYGSDSVGWFAFTGDNETDSRSRIDDLNGLTDGVTIFAAGTIQGNARWPVADPSPDPGTVPLGVSLVTVSSEASVQSSTNNVTFRTYLSGSTTNHFSGNPDWRQTAYYLRTMVARPGGGSWSHADVLAVRFEADSSDASPAIYLWGFYYEVAFSEVLPSASLSPSASVSPSPSQTPSPSPSQTPSPSVSASPSPSPSPTERVVVVPTVETLGCGTYEVLIQERGGRAIVGVLEWTSLNWGRVLDETSEAKAVGAAGLTPECCELIGQVKPWRHELAVYRDAALVWTGPVISLAVGADDFEIDARDLSAWWDHRLIHETHSWDAVELAVAFEALHEDAMAPDDSPNISLTTTFSGVTGMYRVSQLQHQVAGSALRELTNIGIDWTAIGRTIRAGGLVVPTVAMGPFLDQHFAEPPRPTLSGAQQTNKPLVRGAGGGVGGDRVFASALDSDAMHADGLLESVETVQTISDWNSATQAAQTRLELRREIAQVEQAHLLPTAPFSIDALVPGALCRLVLSETCIPAYGTFRLKSVGVAVSAGEDDTVTLNFQPLGTTKTGEE